MIKASKLFCLIFITVAASSGISRSQSSSDPVTQATEEAIHRQADTISLRKTLAAAQSAQQRKDLAAANKLYEKCYALVINIGAGVELEASQTISGLTGVLMDLAHRAQDRHDYKAAEEYFNRILVVDPRNQIALDAKRENRRLLERQAGTIPSQDQIEKIPVWRTNEIRIATMVQDGKLLMEAGKLDEAEEKLNRAYEEDPSSVAAYSYLQNIKQKRMADASRKGELASADSLIQVEKDWTKQVRTGEFVQRPNLYARTNLVHTGPGRQEILSKLDRIHVDSVKYDNLPLGEVINNLNEIARSRDPDRKGINFVVNRQTPSSPGAGVGAIDPTTGLPVASLPTDQQDILSITVKIAPALTDVRLADVLDAITRSAEPGPGKGIKYSVLEYAVEFSLKGADIVPLELRTFHVDPNTFRQGLESVSGIPFANVTTSSGSGGGGSSGGGGGGAGGASGQTGITLLPQVSVTPGGAQISGGGTGGGGGGGGAGGQGAGGLRYVTSQSNLVSIAEIEVRQFFTAIGVDINTNNPANVGKMFAWNDRRGILTVRATSQDLDMIDAAIIALNQAAPQVNIKAKFIEITQNDNRALGFDWILGNTVLGGTTLSGGSQPAMNGVPTTANPLGTFPQNTVQNANQGDITSGLRNVFGSGSTQQAIPTIGTLTGILTDPQFRVAINALEQRDGVEELNAPEVTTESGRQAQIQAVEIQTIVTGQSITASQGSGVTGVANGVNSPIVQQTPINNYQTSPLPFGPVLDVIPYVSADEYSVQMTLIPTITEFEGYDDPGQFVPSALVSGQTGNATLQAVLPLPHFRMRQVTTSVTVWDAQTVVMGGLITDLVTKIKDKVPMLGDLPLVGRLFQSESSSKSKKNLMIFVTPTIINPDGTRFHSDDEMPFMQSGVPTPKPANP